MGYQGGSASNDSFDTNPPDGVFERTMPATATLTFASVTDGLSNTLFVGERSPSIAPWCAWAAGNGVWVTSRYTINQARKQTQTTPLNQEAGGVKYGAISFHTNGAMGLLGDGSVQFLSDTMNQTVYMQLASHMDGGPVGGF